LYSKLNDDTIITPLGIGLRWRHSSFEREERAAITLFLFCQKNIPAFSGHFKWAVYTIFGHRTWASTTLFRRAL